MNAASSARLLPGFRDPVFGSQAVFRTLMSCVAYPGRIYTLDESVSGPGILDPATTEIRPSNGRYIAHNRRYNATFGHSGFNESDLPPERALPPSAPGADSPLRSLSSNSRTMGVVS